MQSSPQMPSAKPLAVTYLRVSTKEQAERDGDPEGYSIPAQREANRRKAESLGVDLVAEFVDRGESARSADRPELKRMLQFVREQPIEYCLVHKVDRLARNRADDVEINLALSAAGVRLVSATENIDETPSGMLLHGIMSSIAEFYSRNLATEVSKGLMQKAKSGGTVTRAPLGYRNIHSLDDQGRENRSVAVDDQRAPLIAWAFSRYAEGDITLADLAAELTARGLTTPATPKRAAKPLEANALQKILTNPYYKGVVVYRGMTYPGRHEPLVTTALWEKVQRALSTRRVGEKVRKHHHYLKSSVYCGECNSRMIVHHAVNRHGSTYDYFVCLGRHQKRTTCQMAAVPIRLVEHKILEHYKSIALPSELRESLQATLLRELEAITEDAATEAKQLAQQRHALDEKRRKLLQAHYAGAIPLDLLKTEQDTIAREIARIDERTLAMEASNEDLRVNLDAAMSLAENCHEAYRRATPHQRRMINQAVFDRIYVHDDAEIDGLLAEPFDTLLDAETLNLATSTDRATPKSGQRETRSTPTGENRVQRHGRGSKEPVLVELRGLEPLTFSMRTRRATSCATAPQAT